MRKEEKRAYHRAGSSAMDREFRRSDSQRTGRCVAAARTERPAGSARTTGTNSVRAGRSAATVSAKARGRAAKNKGTGFFRKFLFGASFTLALGFIAFGPLSSMIHPDAAYVQAESMESSIEYKIIEIKQGDSLWSIACEYKSDDCDNVNDYVKEIKRCNSLKSDMINEGASLLIPCHK